MIKTVLFFFFLMKLRPLLQIRFFFIFCAFILLNKRIFLDNLPKEAIFRWKFDISQINGTHSKKKSSSRLC